MKIYQWCIFESQLDVLVLEQEISTDNYKILLCDRNRHGPGVAYYKRNGLSYNIRSVFPCEFEKIISLTFYYLTPNQ